MFPELGSTSLRMLGSLMVVVGVILVFFYMARRLKLKGSFHSARIPQMRLLGTLNVAPKRALALVEFSDQWLIVGIGSESVNLITQMDRPSIPEQDEPPGRLEGKRFQDFLSKTGLLQPWKKNPGKRKEDAPQ